MRTLFFLLLIFSFAPILLAQSDTTFVDPTDLQEQLIEDVAANDGSETDEFEFNAAFDVLETYARRPLNLNRATEEQLFDLQLLSPIQINQLLDYRDRMGEIISPLELQAIPAMDLLTLRRLRPFVSVGKGLDDAKTPLARMLKEGDREVFVRWQRRLERARGYELGPDDGRAFYLGNPDRLYTRFRHRYGNQMSIGFTAEKDPGEPFFRATNSRRGFDFYSGHFFLKDVNRRVKAIAIGDYNVSFGQGLILFTGFGFGKSIQSTAVARGGPTLRPYTSVSEHNFFRGAATTLAFGPKVELTIFGSRRGRTANLSAVPDTIAFPEEIMGVSSLNTSGFHRTPGEAEDRNSLRQTSYGGSLRIKPSRRLSLGFNFLGEQLSRPLDLNDRLFNRFFFRGTSLHNASVDYRYRYKNFTFFGEAAGSESGGLALLHGLMLGLNRYADFSAVYRNYSVDYQSLSARPFGERSNGRNEEGLYFGLELRPRKHWRINAYYDLFRFPFFNFRVDGPDQGHEYRLRFTYAKKRQFEVYAEVRSQTRGINGIPGQFGALRPVVPETRFQARVNFRGQISPQISWQSRLDYGFTDEGDAERLTGYALLQDISWKPSASWSITGRFAVFNTDDFAVRFYQYENGLLYNARILPYYDQGTRSFLLLRYKGIRRLALEARIAQTFFTSGRPAGRGLEDTGGSRRTDFGMQAIYKF